MRSLQEYDVSDLIPTFIQTMKHDTDAELRAMAATNLGNYIYQGEVERLSKEKQADIEENLFSVIKEDESDLVRRKAFESLGYSSHKNIPDLINQAYKSGEQTWIASAVFAMGRSLDERWEPEVLKMLTHPSPEIRFEAVRAAGKLELSLALPKLLEYLATAEREIKLAAVMALSQIGGSGLQKIFEQLLVNSQSEKESRIIEEALDRLIFNQSLAVLDDLDPGENWEHSSQVNED
jgi:HEAT repeat protein